MSASSDYVCLRNGPTVPLAPLQLLWRLEDRGLRFRLDGDDLVISPKEHLTDDDREQLRRWKAHVRVIVDYCDSGRADHVQ
jgi:hypothetical protein